MIMLKKIRDKMAMYSREIINTAAAVAFFITYILVCERFGAEPIKTGIIIIILYLISVVLIGITSRVIGSYIGNNITSDVNSPLGNITLDILSRLRQPVIICDENGRIIWYNRETTHKLGKREALYGKNLDFICNTPISDIISAESAAGIDTEVFGSLYSVRGYRLTSQNKGYILMMWQDKTELRAAYKKISDETIITAYIVVDNLDELLQYVQEKYRAVSAEIETVLKKWAEEANGIILEYERDRYFYIFDAEHLNKFISDKFDILDKIRDIRIGDSSLPVTVSIGISGISGSFSEKNRAAKAALDMALQRGGDQVVVKNENELEFYGGRNKGVQKRTKVRARVVANELAALISKSSNVLIMGHRNMDYDALGACAGLARLAIFCGVKTNIIINANDSNIEKGYNKLRRIPEYRNIFADALYGQDMITSETLLIIADVNNRLQFENADIADNAFNIVIIDHHRKKEEFKRPPAMAYIEPSASSACELVAEILEQAMPAGQLPKDEADMMFAGILLDTKQFTRNTGSRTFNAALYLRNEGANPADVQELFKVNIDDYMRESRFSANIYTYHSFIAVAINESVDNTSADRISAAKAADKLLSLEGIEVSFAMCKIGNSILISARSSGSVNVQLIIEKLGGGGHFDAAATQIEGIEIPQAIEKLKAAIDDFLDEV